MFFTLKNTGKVESPEMCLAEVKENRTETNKIKAPIKLITKKTKKMAYPGDPFSTQAIPEDYIKEHKPIPKVIECQRLIAKYADTIHVYNNDVITEDFLHQSDRDQNGS